MSEPIGIAMVLADIRKRFDRAFVAAAEPKPNLSAVPVLAEPTASDEGEKTNPANVDGEVRESTTNELDGDQDSRSGAHSQHQDWRDEEEEWMNQL